MSTDQTPALARATEEFRKHRAKFSEDDTPPSCTGCDFVTPFDADGEWNHPAFHAHRIAATVSAALHDPDGSLARTLGEHRVLGGQWGGRGGRWAIRCTCGWETTWTESRRERIAEHEGHVADAVRAAILGADS